MTSTRSQATELTEPIDDPEQLLRRHSTMADLRPQDTPNPEEAHAEQSEEATGDPGNAATNTATDAEATRVPENPREPVTPETGNRGDLYLPDMKNTRMKEACKKGIALGAGLFVVSCEGLKEFYDHTTLAIDTNSGNIEMYINGDFSTFPLNASENPFPEDILREILKSDAEKKQEGGIPGRDLEKKFNRPLTREELDTRLGTFSQLVEMATVNFVMMEDTERQPYAIRIKDMLKLERRRGAIDKQLDELTIVFLADNDKRHEQGLRKYDIPKLRPTNTLITTREHADKYTRDSNNECYRILCSAFKGDTPYKIGEATETETEENIAAATVTPMITVESPATTATNVENRQVAAHTTVTVPPVPATVTAPTMPSMATAPPVTAVAEAPNLRALTIGTANNGTGESFHLQAPPPTTGATNASARPGVTFGATPNISDINARMMEIANNGPPATTTTDRPDRQRQWSSNRGFMETRSCYGCGEQGHLSKNCPNRPYCSHCRTSTHNTEQCRSKATSTWNQAQPLASTPAESPGAGGYHPVQSPAGAYTGAGFPATSQIPNTSPANTSTQDVVLQAFMTKLEENNVQTERTEDRRRMLDKLDTFYGDDRSKCLPWINMVEQTAKCCDLTLRKALLAKSGPAVFDIIANSPLTSTDLELKTLVLEHFSDVGTLSEAAQKLRTMKMPPNKPLTSWNHEWTAVHEIAYRTPPQIQRMVPVIEDYMKSLEDGVADRVSEKFSKVGSSLETLAQVMDMAVRVDKENRTVQYRRTQRQGLHNDTKILDTVNQITTPVEISVIQDHSGPMSSTMRSSSHHGDHRSFNRSRQDSFGRSRRDSGFDNNSNRSFNGGYRKINKYQHRPGNPKNNIRFEYAAGKGDQELYRVLHRMIDFLKGMSVNDRQKFKEFRKYSPRTVNEISEDQIATVAINEICDALHSDVDLVYDALVASDYIEEISEA